MWLTDEQRALQETVRHALERQSNIRAVMDSPAGYDTELWSVLCKQVGVAGLLIPSQFGGADAGVREIQVVLEELGRTLTPSPLLGSAVLAAKAVLTTGNVLAYQRLLPGIADGSRIAALVWTGVEGRWDPKRTACSPGITGVAHYVLDGDLADVLLVAVGGDLFEVDPDQPGVQRERVNTMDPTRRLTKVKLTNADGCLLGPVDLAAVRDLACAALSAEQVGAAARCLELTVEYTRSRVQFGRPIGSFQALKHRMADLHVLVETARSASWAATSPEGAAVAKVYCSEAFTRVAAEMIQLHGGIAITWEHDAHLYFKRAHATTHLFGHPSTHLPQPVGVPASTTKPA